MSANIFNAAQVKMLGDNLDRKAIKSRSQGGTSVQYIEGWRAISEANRIFGAGAWDHEVVEIKETNRDKVAIERRKGNEPAVIEDQWRIGYFAKVRVTVHGEDGQSRVKEGIGFGSGMSKDNAIGEAIESAAKEAETDALKRALIKFGNPFGLALYDKDRASVGHAEHGDIDINDAASCDPPAARKPTASRQIEREAPRADDVPAVRREMAEKNAAEIIRRLGIAESPEDLTEILHAAGGVLARLDAGYPDLRQSVREAETQAKRRVAPANGANGHHPDGIAV